MTDFLEVNGRRYGCDLRGSGPAVVMLHAALATRRMYDPLLHALEDDFTVLAYDQPGYGDSPRAQDPISPVHDLVALLDAAGIESAVLVGTSFGCRVAFDAALAAPERVGGVVAAGPGLSGRVVGPDLKAASEEVDRALQAGNVDLANELEMRIWLDGVGRVSPVDPAVRAQVAAMNRQLLEQELGGYELQELPPRRAAVDSLGNVACPVLVVVGDCDQPHCLETARMIGDQVANVRVEVLPQTAHVPSLERPQEFAALVREFVGVIRHYRQDESNTKARTPPRPARGG